MIGRERQRADARLSSAVAGSVGAPQRRRYRVFIEGVKTQYETPEAFAIKFGLAVNQPVTKIRHLLRSLPAMLWEGANANMAARLLALIDEAGGQGRIDEIEAGQERVETASAAETVSPAAEPGRVEEGREEPPAEKTAEPQGDRPRPRHPAASCPKCGFPAGEGDRYCQFCMSPLEERRKKRAASIDHSPSVHRGAIPQKRMLLYLGIVLIALIVHAVLAI